MAIQQAKDLLTKSDATAQELRTSIAKLKVEKWYVQECIDTGLRESESGNIVINEISTLIKNLEEKIKCTN